jgi:hypothetical protein
MAEEVEMMFIQVKGGAGKMGKKDECCYICNGFLEGLGDVITLTLQKGIRAKTKTFKFCQEDCFVEWIFDMADRVHYDEIDDILWEPEAILFQRILERRPDFKKILENLQEAVDGIRERRRR